jgi:hypothetical protein
LFTGSFQVEAVDQATTRAEAVSWCPLLRKNNLAVIRTGRQLASWSGGGKA